MKVKNKNKADESKEKEVASRNEKGEIGDVGILLKIPHGSECAVISVPRHEISDLIVVVRVPCQAPDAHRHLVQCTFTQANARLPRSMHVNAA